MLDHEIPLPKLIYSSFQNIKEEVITSFWNSRRETEQTIEILKHGFVKRCEILAGLANWRENIDRSSVTISKKQESNLWITLFRAKSPQDTYVLDTI